MSEKLDRAVLLGREVAPPYPEADRVPAGEAAAARGQQDEGRQRVLSGQDAQEPLHCRPAPRVDGDGLVGQWPHDHPCDRDSKEATSRLKRRYHGRTRDGGDYNTRGKG